MVISWLYYRNVRMMVLLGGDYPFCRGGLIMMDWGIYGGKGFLVNS